MGARRLSAATVSVAALLLLSPTAAHAGSAGTPAGTGGGCKANGQEVAGNAKQLRPFGATVVSQNVPIAPLVASFFTRLCGGAQR